MVAIASLVDNAVGAWAPTLLTREFHMDRAQVGMELGIMLTAAFGGGVLIGGWLADKAGVSGGWSRKLLVCLVAGALILPVAASLNAGNVTLVMLSVPAYFALSGHRHRMRFLRNPRRRSQPLARPRHVHQLLSERGHRWRSGPHGCCHVQ